MDPSKDDDSSSPPPWSPPSPKPTARSVRALPSLPTLSPLHPPPPPPSLPCVDEEASWEERVILSEDGPGLDRHTTRLPNYGEARAGVGRRLVVVNNWDEEVDEAEARGESSTSTSRSYSYPYPPETPIEGGFTPDLFPSSPTGSTISSLAPLTPSNSTSSSRPRIRFRHSPPHLEASTSSHYPQYPVEKARSPSSSPPPPPRPFDPNRRSLSPLASFHHPQTGSPATSYSTSPLTFMSSSASTTSSSSSEHSHPSEKPRSSSSRSSSHSSHTASPPPRSITSSSPPPPPTPTPTLIESPQIIPSFDPLIAYNPRPTTSGASSTTSLSTSMSAAERRRSLQAQTPSPFTRGGSLSRQLGQLSLRSGELGGRGGGGAGEQGGLGGVSTRSNDGEGERGGTRPRPRSSSTWSSWTG